VTTFVDRHDLTSATGEHLDLEALIKEARRLRRRRYFTFGVVLLIVVGGTTVGLAIGHGGGHRSPGTGHSHAVPAAPKAVPPTSAARVSEAVHPSSALFNQISATPKGLLLTGETRATFQSSKPTCVVASVNPRTLAVGARYGELW
jgi:hypothetical protein